MQLSPDALATCVAALVTIRSVTLQVDQTSNGKERLASIDNAIAELRALSELNAAPPPQGGVTKELREAIDYLLRTAYFDKSAESYMAYARKWLDAQNTDAGSAGGQG